MLSKVHCPVPKDQIPIEEYLQLKKSWFFSWPFGNASELIIKLIASWLIILPINLILSSGSQTLSKNWTELIIVSLVISLGFPFLLLLRQILSWKYIKSRLLSEIIEYEETGWYDGQNWRKPYDWNDKDKLIAQHELSPVIENIKVALIINILLIIAGIELIKYYYI